MYLVLHELRDNGAERRTLVDGHQWAGLEHGLAHAGQEVRHAVDELHEAQRHQQRDVRSAEVAHQLPVVVHHRQRGQAVSLHGAERVDGGRGGAHALDAARLCARQAQLLHRAERVVAQQRHRVCVHKAQHVHLREHIHELAGLVSQREVMHAGCEDANRTRQRRGLWKRYPWVGLREVYNI